MTAPAEARTTTAGTPNLNKALSLLQGELPKVTKSKEGEVSGQNKDGKFFSYKYGYADLADVTAAIGPLLAKYGLAFHAKPTRDPADRREMVLIWKLKHESGEEESGEWPLGPSSQKPQSLGSAVTYGRRYCLCSATGIVAEDDDDGQRAQRDHASRHSAGDVFDNAAPTRPARSPRSQGNGQPAQDPTSRPAAISGNPATGRNAQPATPTSSAPDDDPFYSRSWLDMALDQSVSFETEAAGAKLWRESVAKARAGEITAEDARQVQERITAQVEHLRKQSSEKILEQLAEDDPWRDKAREISDEEEARKALEELAGLVPERVDMTRADRISRAIALRFPKAAPRENEAAR